MTLAIRSFLVLVLAVAAAAVGGDVSASRTSTATATDAGIVYAHGNDLYVRAGDRVRRLTRDRVADGMPAWSPDRTRIAFVRNGNIHVMNADGTGIRQLTRGSINLYPAWSPRGDLIAFSSTRVRNGGESEIYVMRADGSQVRRLTHGPRYGASTQPAFSPDGRYVVFNSNRIAYWNYELFRVRVADGGGLKRLTFYGSGKDGAPGDDLMPSYSPDGKRIAFVSDRKGGYAIWTMKADGTGLREVSRHPRRNHAFPRYSPDGRSLVYMTFSPDSAEIVGRLWTVRTDGSQRASIGLGREPDW